MLCIMSSEATYYILKHHQFITGLGQPITVVMDAPPGGGSPKVDGSVSEAQEASSVSTAPFADELQDDMQPRISGRGSVKPGNANLLNRTLRSLNPFKARRLSRHVDVFAAKPSGELLSCGRYNAEKHKGWRALVQP